MVIEAAAGTTINATVFTGRWSDMQIGGTFPPTTATLLTGPTEAILVDAAFLTDDVSALGNLIADTGKKLTTIYITHGHADHFFGIASLLQRFPQARAFALPSVIDYIGDTVAEQTQQWNAMFGDRVVKCEVLPEVLDTSTLFIDGVAADVIEVEQADITPSSIVHVPSTGVVVAGDAVYNEIHPMLGLSTPQQWRKWIGTLDVVQRLDPTMIVAGHKRPDSDDRAVQAMLSTTRAYIEDFARACENASGADELIAAMVEKYPGHGNRWTLEFSASQALSNRTR
jgi:glyoxylase-like metal-dependent hydrolase (beta-lactamase superfamily II)